MTDNLPPLTPEELEEGKGLCVYYADVAEWESAAARARALFPRALAHIEALQAEIARLNAALRDEQTAYRSLLAREKTLVSDLLRLIKERDASGGAG